MNSSPSTEDTFDSNSEISDDYNTNSKIELDRSNHFNTNTNIEEDDSNTDIEIDRYDIDTIRTRADKPIRKNNESRYRYYDDETYEDDGYIHSEFGKIQQIHGHSNSTATNVIRNCLLCIEGFNLFSCGGSISDALLPGLYIDEIGYIGFPLGEEQVKHIISKSKMAPFGRKEKTIFDKNVRHTWQMEPSQFIIKNSKWDSAIGSLVNHVCKKLRYDSEDVKHSLYKLLIYEPGNFFKPHRDTEKEEGMFGTLIVVLPSIYSGGQLVVRHCDREYEYDFSDMENAFETNFAAFYADCEHEIKPVVTGYRICLVYNLVNKGTKIPPTVKHNSVILKEIIEATRDWVINAYTCPALLVYGLEHRYTNAGLSFNGLKGKDIIIAQVLKTVSESIPLDIVLVNMKRGLIGDSLERVTILHCISETGEPQPFLKNFLICHDNMVQAQFWKNKNDDDEGYIPTGNEGAELARFYYHTGIIFSPKQIRHHKYVRENVLLSKSIKYLNTLEEDHQEATSVLIWKMKQDFSHVDFCKKDLFNLYSILFRYDYADLALDFVDIVTHHDFFDSRNTLNKMAWELHTKFPTISITPAFRILVGHNMKTLEKKRQWEMESENKKAIMDFRKLLDVDFA